MHFSAGWFLLIGGLVGVVRNARTKRYYQSDFASFDGVITEEQRKTVVPISSAQRLGLIALCLLLAIAGVVLIQHQHNWNPFVAG